MPLSEFLRMARGKLESSQQKPCPTDISTRPENDLVELVWENGRIVMQGQSSRVNRSPTRNNLSPNTSRARGLARFGKFGGVESVLNDVESVVPSGELDLGQDDEMAPWLSYPMDDGLAQDYVSEFLPEISGVTGNGMSNQNSFVSVEKRGSCDQTFSNLHSGASTLKDPPSSSRDRPVCSWAPQHRQMSDALGSGVLDIVSNNTRTHPDAAPVNSSQGIDVVNGSTSTKIERPSVRPRANTSNFLNFSHFSRPANLFKANLPNSNGIRASGSSGVELMEIKEKGSAVGVSNPVKSTLTERFNSMPKDIDLQGSSAKFPVVNSREPVANAPKASCPPERTEDLCRETPVKNDKPPIISNADNSTKGVPPEGERTVEYMVASSSVGSGNSADRVSGEQTHNSKRKFREVEESDCRSDDVETESADIRKSTPVRGSKRSRAAEVHNLSERRRRDRINEKMRALQELIPNCNKADKASMLDEAIEYLKTLQLQVQIMSMGAGLCMPPMMFPTGMQPMHPAHVSHFPPMGVGMGPGMGYGMGMLDMNGGSSGCPIYPVPPMQVAQFPPQVSGIANFPRIPSPNLGVFGHPGQVLPNSVPRGPFVPLTVPPPALVASAMGLNASRNGSSNEVPGTSSIMNPKVPVTATNSQSLRNAEACSSINDTSDQATNEALDQSASVQDNKQGTDPSGPTALASTASTDVSKEPGCD